MCGIVGLITNKEVNSINIIDSMQSIKSRGPDDSGVWIEDNIGLGHQRLSIIDISNAGHQPMISACGRYVIVFNGEIYNFKEVKQKLIGHYTNWFSNSDTEVILAAFVTWGNSCVNHFQGMFAFAIWDRKKKSLFAARDRMGVKPFYYHSSNNCFAFASRPRAIFKLCNELQLQIDEQALRYYLESGYVPAPYSIFQNIYKLPPAHYLTVKNGKESLKRYWDFRNIEPEYNWEERKEDDLLDELDEIVSNSVRSRMISDVPLGAFLSGGIDSSLVVAIMKKYSNNPIKTFTIGFEEEKYDESKYALSVAKYLSTEHYCETLHIDDLINLKPIFQNEFDEPFFDCSAYPVMAVSRLARQHVTVSLSGDGGDELFGGYHYYYIAKQLEKIYILPQILRKSASSLVKYLPSDKYKLLSGAMSRKNIIESIAFSRSISKDYKSILHPDIIKNTESLSQLFIKASNSFPPKLPASDKAMRLDAFYTLPDDYLQKVDVSSMAFSLESRDPLLDHTLVEWSMKLPSSLKLRGKTNKYLLRRLAYRYIPQNLLDRPKRGFDVPINNWLRGPLKKWAEERFSDKSLFEKLPLNQFEILNLWELHKNGSRNTHPQLWAILVLLDFYQKYGIKI